VDPVLKPGMRSSPILLLGSLSLAALAMGAAGCGNNVGFKGKAIPPIAIIKGDSTGPGGPNSPGLELDGSDSYDPNATSGKGIFSWAWTLKTAPAGSNATITPNGNDPSLGDLTLDVPGRYVVSLTVRDINDFAFSQPTDYEVYAFPITGVTILLKWSTSVNDVDLHLVNETENGSFFAVPGDCYFANLRPDWGPVGIAGDPSLHHDEVNGFGPETTELPTPVIGNQYHAYVHYFSDDSLGPTDVTVQFYANGMLSLEMKHDQITGNQVWDLATVAWTGVDATISPIDTMSMY
jgi:hypothetical protein